MSGIASSVITAPVYDEKRRPITAGGFVDKGPVVFEDITKQAGLSGWIHKMGVPEKKFIVETNGSGVCLVDYDNDGLWLAKIPSACIFIAFQLALIGRSNQLLTVKIS